MADIPAVPEIDQQGGDDLPTYDDLAAQNGPNSRCVLSLILLFSLVPCSNKYHQLWPLEGMGREEVRVVHMVLLLIPSLFTRKTSGQLNVMPI